MAVGWDRPAPPAEETAITRVEHELGIELPAEYREFLGRQNGGEPEPNFLEGGEDIGGAHVRYFLSAGPSGIEGLEDLESVRWEYSRDGDADYVLDTSVLPIGQDAFGNLICLKVSGEDYGAVYIWDHEEADDAEAYARATGSFNAFFEALRPEDELDVS